MNRHIWAVLAMTTVLYLGGCGNDPAITEAERVEAGQAGYGVGYSWGADWPSDIGVWWITPKAVEERHRDRPIPSLYVGPEDFQNEADSNRKEALADAYNWGVYCGFNDATGTAAHVSLLGRRDMEVYEICYGE